MEKIQSIFDEAGLNEEDRSLWLSRLAGFGEKFQKTFIGVFGGDPQALRFFTDDLRGRVSAGNDPEKLAAVMEKEREYFRSVLSGLPTE